MTLLLKVRGIESDLRGLLESAEFPKSEESKALVKAAFGDAIDSLSKLALAIEKAFQDDELSNQLLTEILSKVNGSDVYNVLSDKEKTEVASRIVESADRQVLTKVEFSQYVTDRLRELSDDDLAKAAYSRRDITSLGQAVTEGIQPEQVYYEAGFEVVRNFVQTPSGRDEALSKAGRRIVESPSDSRKMLKLYYAI